MISISTPDNQLRWKVDGTPQEPGEPADGSINQAYCGKITAFTTGTELLSQVALAADPDACSNPGLHELTVSADSNGCVVWSLDGEPLACVPSSSSLPCEFFGVSSGIEAWKACSNPPCAELPKSPSSVEVTVDPSDPACGP